MPAWAIVVRELVTASRQPRTYRRRCSLVTLMLVFLGAFYAICWFWYRGRLPAGSVAAYARTAVAFFVFFQYNLALWLMPIYVAGGIAAERERRTLGDLLSTRLSSAEIILSKLAVGLAQVGVCVALGLPAIGLLHLLGGVDADLLWLAYAGIASTVLFVGGVSILISTGCRRNTQAIPAALGLMAAWLMFPTVAWAMAPSAIPRLWPWLRPINNWLVASSPFSAFLNTLGIRFGWSVHEGFVWMIAIQTAAGSLMVGWAIARLRPLSCKLEDGEGRRLTRHRWRLIRRPPCAESPILWKEMHTAKTAGFTQLSEMLAIGIIFVLIAYETCRFGWPAVLEWFAYLSGNSHADLCRTAFNQYLRVITSVVELVCLIIVGGAAAEGIASERAQSTWDGVLATPLSGHEILRAKMIGAAWNARWGIVLLLALWSAGLLAGSLHPLGFVAALILLIVSTWFMASLGTYSSLVSRDAAHATARTTLALIALTCTFMLCYFYGPNGSVILGAGSVPFVNWLGLATYRDVAEAVRYGSFDNLGTMGVSTREGAARVLTTYLVAVAGYAATAAWFTWNAFGRFDRVAGRPCASIRTRRVS